jgi:hypothetical protein
LTHIYAHDRALDAHIRSPIHRYNDISVLENYHTYQLFDVMSHEEYNLLADFNKPVSSRLVTAD